MTFTPLHPTRIPITSNPLFGKAIKKWTLTFSSLRVLERIFPKQMHPFPKRTGTSNRPLLHSSRGEAFSFLKSSTILFYIKLGLLTHRKKKHYWRNVNGQKSYWGHNNDVCYMFIVCEWVRFCDVIISLLFVILLTRRAIHCDARDGIDRLRSFHFRLPQLLHSLW